MKNPVWLLPMRTSARDWNSRSRNGWDMDGSARAPGTRPVAARTCCSEKMPAERGSWKSWRMRSSEVKNHARSRTIGPPNEPPSCRRLNGCFPKPPFSVFEK